MFFRYAQHMTLNRYADVPQSPLPEAPAPKMPSTGAIAIAPTTRQIAQTVSTQCVKTKSEGTLSMFLLAMGAAGLIVGILISVILPPFGLPMLIIGIGFGVAGLGVKVGEWTRPPDYCIPRQSLWTNRQPVDDPDDNDDDLGDDDPPNESDAMTSDDVET
ncbi:MAG: hypothetical protein LBH53_00560 [Puniceicoccales bacterium]|nr:hypothetical protein [Puniceicoccales bacterium]